MDLPENETRLRIRKIPSASRVHIGSKVAPTAPAYHFLHEFNVCRKSAVGISGAGLQGK